jgi:lysophospholipase L1-like esterase
MVVTAAAFGFLADKAQFWRAQLYKIQRLSGQTRSDEYASLRVLFIGDSIIESYPVKAMLPQRYHVLNEGVRGDGTEDIALRYSQIINQMPHEVVVVEGGINDIMGAVVEKKDEKAILGTILKSYETILTMATIRGIQPLCMEILPVTDRFLLPYSKAIALPSEFDAVTVNTFVRKTNKNLKQLCSQKSAPIITVFDAFLADDTKARREFMHADGYHVNVFGYEKLSQIVDQELAKLSNR